MPAGRRFASVVAAASAAVVPVVLTGTAGAVAAVHAPVAGGTLGAAGTWGSALTPPGLSSLEQGAGPASSDVSVVSCASAGNCSAAGYYPRPAGQGGGNNLAGYVVNKVNGTWRNVIKIAGITLSPSGGGRVQPLSVSCAKAGECSVVGAYEVAPSAPGHAFITSEVHGTWHAATAVPGIVALDNGGNAYLESVSCTSPGNCSAGGGYSASTGIGQAFAVDEIDGIWHSAVTVPGITGLNHGGAAITSISCVSPGNCSADGQYRDSAGRTQAFAVNKVNGTWHKAIAIPGIVALNPGGFAVVASVSCASAGNCSAGGTYTDGSKHVQAFIVNEVNGTWHQAIKVPGTTALEQGGGAGLNSVSCASAGNCSAGGYYNSGAFVVNEVNGTWHQAIKVPGTIAVDQYSVGGVAAVSCAAPGNCSAAGTFRSRLDPLGHENSFVVNEVNGTWHTAIAVPGLARLSQSGSAHFYALSCGAVGNCSAGGIYDFADNPADERAFLVSEK
jgi:hypothetical protein